MAVFSCDISTAPHTSLSVPVFASPTELTVVVDPVNTVDVDVVVKVSVVSMTTLDNDCCCSRVVGTFKDSRFDLLAFVAARLLPKRVRGSMTLTDFKPS